MFIIDTAVGLPPSAEVTFIFLVVEALVLIAVLAVALAAVLCVLWFSLFLLLLLLLS